MTIIRIISILTAWFVLAAAGREAEAHAVCASADAAPGPGIAAPGVRCDKAVAAPSCPAVFSERMPIVSDPFVLICDIVPGFEVCRQSCGYAYGFLFSGLSPP